MKLTDLTDERKSLESELRGLDRTDERARNELQKRRLRRDKINQRLGAISAAENMLAGFPVIEPDITNGEAKKEQRPEYGQGISTVRKVLKINQGTSLSATEICAIASNQQGMILKQGSVRSILRRLIDSGEVVKDGTKYLISKQELPLQETRKPRVPLSPLEKLRGQLKEATE